MRPRIKICKNCVCLKVFARIRAEKVGKGASNEEIAAMMRAVADVENRLTLRCTFNPHWEKVQEMHFCSQFAYRPNWQNGYQDIERTWEEVDRVYETRWDCMAVPGGARRQAA